MAGSRGTYFGRAFTLIELALVIAILGTLGGIALRLFGPKSFFHNGVVSFNAYMRAVCEYALVDGRNCYLLCGSGRGGDEKISQLVLVELDGDGNANFVAGYAHRLHRNEFIQEPGTGNGSRFSTVEVTPPAEWAGRRYYAIDLRHPLADEIRLVLSFRVSKNTLYHEVVISPSGAVRQGQIF